MTKKYVEFPKTILSLANELKKICDDYFNKTLSLKELEELLVFYKDNNTNKLLKDNRLNPTVKLKVGKTRAELINKVLELEG